MNNLGNEGILYSSEEMDQMVHKTSEEQDNLPVTVLGITFANDAKRLEYFQEELRKKLPMLRELQGFPLGSDEDIINLSNPPYYTACPNPWLKNIVEEWEAEKEDLITAGIRKKSKKVSFPYAYGIKQGKNSTIYNAHSYHTKVPHEIIMRYILHYTQPGDIVLDSFAGTGMMGVAASACGNTDKETKELIENDFAENNLRKPVWGERHAICGDLSPICYHISSNYNSNVNTDLLQKSVNEIVKRLKNKFGYFYEVKTNMGLGHINYFVWSEVVSCNSCGAEMNVHDLSFDYRTRTLHEKMTCPNCGSVQSRTEANPIEETIYDELANKTVSQIKYECSLLNVSIPGHGRHFIKEIPNVSFPVFEGYIPVNQIPYEGDEIPRLHRVGCDYINQMYHKRTQYVLGYLYYLINTEFKSQHKELMFIFTSMLPKLTRMNRYMPQHGSRALVGPMANTLYIPPQGVENNPIDQFEYQAKKVIKALDLCNGGNVVQLASATNSLLPNNSVDYIFTDPPFGSNIMYSELNTISESWLKVMTNNEEEAISNNTQHKGIMEYQEIMTNCFKEYNRVLKPGKWMTVEFSNTSAAFWNSLQYSIKSAGFIISAITDLNKERGGLQAMIGPTAVKQDLAISCYKPSRKITDDVKNNAAASIWDLVQEHLDHVVTYIKKGSKAFSITERDPRVIYDRIISFCVQNGQSIPVSSQEFQKGLRERYLEVDGMFFTAAQAAEYELHKNDALEFVPMGLLVTDEANGIAWLKNELVIPQTRSELHPKWMKALEEGNARRKGAYLPDLSQLLEENFIEIEGGKWRLPNIQDEVDKEALRTKALLREFKLYVEQAQMPRARIREARVEALRAGFKQCYIDKDFKTIVLVGDKIPQNLLEEDEVLLQFYDIALNKL